MSPQGRGDRPIVAGHAHPRFGPTRLGGILNNSLGTRLDLKPRPILNLFLEARTSGASPRTESRNAKAGLDYSSRRGLRLYSDASFSAKDQYTANCGAAYALGKTALSLKYSHTEYTSSSSYSYLSVSLSRSL